MENEPEEKIEYVNEGQDSSTGSPLEAAEQKIKKLRRVQLKMYIFLFKNLGNIHSFRQKSKNCVVSSGKCIF